MRLRSGLTVLAASFALLVITRHHLRELAATSRTFASFYPYLGRHPDRIFLYSNSTGARTPVDETPELIPSIIHQISLGSGRDVSPSRYQDAISSCRTLHPNWTHAVWTDETASNFIKQYYPLIWPHYLGYKQNVQRANILRYALLDHFGGVYLDLDVTCLEPLDNLRHLPWLTPAAHPAGLNNAFMLSRPHHAFLKHLIAAVPFSDLTWGLPYVETMLSTGCMFLSSRWMVYARSLSKLEVSVPEADKIYVLADEEGKLGPHMLRGAVTTPLFRHGGASSWHEWDAAAIVLIGRHYCYFVSMIVLGALFAIVMMWRWSASSNGAMRARAHATTGREFIDKRSDRDVNLV